MDYPYKFSIITVNLNNKDGLQKTIESVINQTYQNFEWIIIDGGSKDGSKELIEKYSEHINYWVSEPDKGIYNAMNKGIRSSKGEYLLFLNSGDILFNFEVLNEVVNKLEDHDIYLGNYIIENILYEYSNDYSDLIHTLLLNGFLHQAVFYKSYLFKKYGFYDEEFKIVSDWLFNLKAIILGNVNIALLKKTTTIFDAKGISSNKKEMQREYQHIYSTMIGLEILTNFYIKYYPIIKKIKNKKIILNTGRRILQIMKWI